jgi:hypothetical protein
MSLIRGEQISGSVASASYALTASYVAGGSGAGFPYSGNAVITGSLLVSGSGLTTIGNQVVSGAVNLTGLLTTQNAITTPAGQYFVAYSDTSTEMSWQAPYTPNSPVYSGLGSNYAGTTITNVDTDGNNNALPQKTWIFDHSGSLTVPGKIIFPNGTTINPNTYLEIIPSASNGNLSGIVLWDSVQNNYLVVDDSGSYAQDLDVNGFLKSSNLIATGSLQGTSSYALTASYYRGSVTSASYALTASYAPNYVLNSSTSSFVTNSQTSSFVLNSATASMLQPYVLNSKTASFATTGSNTFIGNQTVAGNLTVQGDLTAQQYILSSSVIYITESFSSGSTIFGNSLDDTHQITGSLLVTGSGTINGFSIITANQTSSFVQNNQTGSFVQNSQTSSFVLNSQTGSFVTNSQTSSFVQNNQTSSFVTNNQTSSFVQNSQTSSFVTNSQTGSFILNSQTGSFVQNSQTSSFVLNSATASMLQPYVLTSVTSSMLNPYVLTSSTSSMTVLSSSYAATSSRTISSSYSITASYYIETDPVFTSRSASLATTGSNIFIGNQTITGSVNLTGSLNQTGNYIHTGSVYHSGSKFLTGVFSQTGSLSISGSTTQIGNNNLYGNTSLSGSITLSGSLSQGVPTVGIFGDTNLTGYLRMLPVTTNIDNSISASYIYVSGSTNDLYFSQNGSGYSNITRLRWLEGNLYTGLLNGGLITTQSSTVFQVGSGSGIIVNLNASYNNNPYPTIQYVNWGNLTASIAPLSASFDQQFIAINSGSQIVAQGIPYTDGEYNTLIPIGLVLHQNHSTINGVKTSPSVAYGWKQRSSDFIRAFGPLKISGYAVLPSGSATGSLVVGNGTAFVDGANYAVDPNNPSYAVDNGTTTSKIFKYYQSGSDWVYNTNNGAGFASIDPVYYNPGGLGILATVGASNYSLQRVFWYPNSVTKAIVVYYGNERYGTLALAQAGLASEAFNEAPNTAANAVYLGAFAIKGGTNTTLQNSAHFTWIPGGLFRGGSSGGGSGGGSTSPGGSNTQIQYNNNGAFDGVTNLTWDGTTLIGTGSFSGSFTGTINGSVATASYAATASYYGGSVATASYALTASYIQNAQTASYVINAISSSYAATASVAPNYVLNSSTSSFVQNSQTSSFVLNSSTSSMSVLSSSYSTTSSYASSIGPLTQDVSINGNLSVIGTASFTYSTASIVQVGASTITLNTNYPATRFGGISVVDSGSFGYSSTGSLFWDSLNNRWIYSNPSGSTYDGGMLISGPRNTSGLGNEAGMDVNFVAVGQGGDHIRPGSIYNSGSITIVTGSLTVTQGITGSFTGSLVGTASYSTQALSASYALTASYVAGAGFPYSGSAVITGSLLVSGSGNFTNGLNVNGTLTNNGIQINTAGLALANYYNFI